MLESLASAISKQEFLKRLCEAMTKSEQDKSNQQDDKVGSSESFTPLNKDDCYGIEFSTEWIREHCSTWNDRMITTAMDNRVEISMPSEL